MDLLGWAYHRIGNYEDAVKNLERAIDLKPRTPPSTTISATPIRRIGRTLEQNSSGRMPATSSPSREDLPKIEAEIGTAAHDTSSAASADKKKEDGKGG